MIIGESIRNTSFPAIVDPVAGREAAEPTPFLQVTEKPFLDRNPDGA